MGQCMSSLKKQNIFWVIIPSFYKGCFFPTVYVHISPIFFFLFAHGGLNYGGTITISENQMGGQETPFILSMMLTVTKMYHRRGSAVLDNGYYISTQVSRLEQGETHLFCVCGEFRVLSSRGSLYQEVREQQSNTVEVTAEPGKYEHAQQSQRALNTNCNLTVAPQVSAAKKELTCCFCVSLFDADCDYVIPIFCPKPQLSLSK